VHRLKPVDGDEVDCGAVEVRRKPVTVTQTKKDPFSFVFIPISLDLFSRTTMQGM
jgi:hypothetical protein